MDECTWANSVWRIWVYCRFHGKYAESQGRKRQYELVLSKQHTLTIIIHTQTFYLNRVHGPYKGKHKHKTHKDRQKEQTVMTVMHKAMYSSML